MTNALVKPRSVAIGLDDDTNWLTKVRTRLARRWRRPSTGPLSDHLLRDAGLERVGGVTRARVG